MVWMAAVAVDGDGDGGGGGDNKNDGHDEGSGGNSATWEGRQVRGTDSKGTMLMVMELERK
jgi:hypothetical protein